MVQRAACIQPTNAASPNGEQLADRDGRASAILAAEDSTVHPSRRPLDDLPRGGSTRFSLFKWFKRAGNREPTIDKRRKTLGRSVDGSDRGQCSAFSSAESVDTFYSTTTVRSFAYRTGTLGKNGGVATPLDILRQAADVGPFAAGATKVAAIGNKENETRGDSATNAASSTLPASARGRDITARYSLQPTATFNSCGNLPLPDKRLSASLRRLDDRGSRSSCNGTARRRVHVKGKRRAPNPPGSSPRTGEVEPRETPRNSNRRKRRAPKPPERVIEGHPEGRQPEGRSPNGGMDVEQPREKEEEQTISNDTLVLQRGVLLPKREITHNPRIVRNGSDANASPDNPSQIPAIGTLSTAAMPRPWYKRSVFEHSRDSGVSRRGDVLRGGANSPHEAKEECTGSGASSSTANYSLDASLSRLSFFHRSGQADERKKEAKRKSGLSILMNISELDKEAAAIVQEEQARARASMLLKTSRLVDAFEKRNDANEELVQDIVASAMETSSPRRGTRALISKFNAISNVTKVTVNANFFARGVKDRHRESPARFERDVAHNARDRDWKDEGKLGCQENKREQIDRDISKYFLPQQQKTPRAKSEAIATDAETKIPGAGKGGDAAGQLAADTSSRISLLQSQLAANRMSEQPQATPKENAVPVMGEKIRSREEPSAGRRREQETRLNNDDTRKYLLPHTAAATSVEQTAKTAVGGVREGVKPARGGKNPNGTPREFSNLLEEIDRHLLAKEFKFADRGTPAAGAAPVSGVPGNQKDKVIEVEAAAVAGTSSKVTKVLDILVEREKDSRTKAAGCAQPLKSMAIADTSRLMDADLKARSGKSRSPALKTTDDPITADLKEMLKEMKHSLPKRPKPRGAREQEAPEGVGIARGTPPSARKTAYFVSAVTKLESIASGNTYETEKQKVSSSVQTSGNVRRLNQSSVSSERPSTSAWKQENVLYRTSGKSLAGAGIVKNTFQLIRPRDFAEIEATKTTRRPCDGNTYANVIEQSLYANAHVPPPSPRQQRADPVAARTPPTSANTERIAKSSPILPARLNANNDTAADSDEDASEADRNMNTLAINRLLRRLEGAIASGHHQQAAGLAKELARLKIHCSVIRQRSALLKDQSIRVNMYIEDKLAHQGPIPLQLPTRMTVAELKVKIFTDFEIPTNVQRWIIGKHLADHDGASLHELQATDDSPIFLYLVAPELKAENPPVVDKVVTAEVEPKPVEEDATAPDVSGQAVPEIQEVIDEQPKVEDSIAQVEVAEEISADLRLERYEELISLENCDVIPNSEPIDCPICFVTYGPREGVILRDCLHMFCRPCLSYTIKYCEDAEVKCPYRDTEYTCESTLQEREIKALVESDIYQQHLAKSIAQAETSAGNNAFHCKTPDCPGWCIYDDNVNNFLCPVCGANNCLTCQVIHAGKNCKQYQQELRLAKETDQESRRTAAMLEEMVDRGEALACPTCAVVLMKKWGCDWLRCSMCKTEICWVTRGPRWGPGGKGDTSGGCRCGENGVKCHPRCNYCH